MTTTACRHFLVSGRVQGVFYRASTEAKASALGLRGWVRNLADGRVELIACGSDEQLSLLERWLWDGPAHARVSDVVATSIAPQQFNSFEVR